MARRGGRVEPEQSNMLLTVNIAKMAKGGFSCAVVDEMLYLIKKPRAEAGLERKRAVEFPGLTKVNAVIKWHQAMLRQNETDGCLPCQNGTAYCPGARWWRKGTGASSPDRRSQLTPELTPPVPAVPLLPGMQPSPTGNDAGAQHSQIINLPARYMYSHATLPCAEFFTLDAYAQDSQQDTDCDPDMLTDEGTSTA